MEHHLVLIARGRKKIEYAPSPLQDEGATRGATCFASLERANGRRPALLQPIIGSCESTCL
jgi:hypothetical protein